MVAVPWRARRYLTFGWFWFLGTLVPMIGIITVGEQSMADRYAYIPFIGLFVAIVWSFNVVASSWRVPNVNVWRAGAAVLPFSFWDVSPIASSLTGATMKLFGAIH